MKDSHELTWSKRKDKDDLFKDEYVESAFELFCSVSLVLPLATKANRTCFFFKKKKDNKGQSICWCKVMLLQCLQSSNVLHPQGPSSCCGCSLHRADVSVNHWLQHIALRRKLFYITAFQFAFFIRTIANTQAPQWITAWKSVSCILFGFVYLEWNQQT